MNINGLGKTSGFFNTINIPQTNSIRNPMPNVIFASQIEFERAQPFTARTDFGLCAVRNSIWLVPGVRIEMEDGHYFSVGESSVISSGDDSESRLAAKGLEYLIRIANGQFTVNFQLQTRRFYDTPGIQAATKNALNAAGINTAGIFYVNNTPFKVINGEIRRIHTRMGDFIDERGMSILAQKYENQALHNDAADYILGENEADD